MAVLGSAGVHTPVSACASSAHAIGDAEPVLFGRREEEGAPLRHRFGVHYAGVTEAVVARHCAHYFELAKQGGKV